MEEQHSGKIIAHVDNDLADLIPGYLTNRKKDKDAIRAKRGTGKNCEACLHFR